MLIQGTLYRQWKKCNKATCVCRREAAYRHGPYWYLRWWQEGRWRKRYVAAADVPAIRALITTRMCLQQELRDTRRQLDVMERTVRGLGKE